MLRDMGRMAVTAVFLAGSAVCADPAGAQVRIQNGVVIRPDLKGPVSPIGITIEGASSEAEKPCNTSEICQTPLLVSPGGLKLIAVVPFPKYVWDPKGCSVYWPYNKIIVKGRQQPILRWILVKDPDDHETYSFDSLNGILLWGNDPTNENDARFDLFKPRLEKDGTAFVWYDLHLRSRTLPFIPIVSRANKSGPPTICNAGDPHVVNEN